MAELGDHYRIASAGATRSRGAVQIKVAAQWFDPKRAASFPEIGVSPMSEGRHSRSGDEARQPTTLETIEERGAFVTAGMQLDWSKVMGDPREYEGGNSDDEEVLPEAGEEDLEELDEDGEPLSGEERPLNDGDEAIEEEDDA